jgi:hypothetical protein
MATLLVPLDAVQVAGDISHGINRKLTQLSTAAGKFSVRAHTLGPVGTHPIHLDLITVEEIDDFWDWYDTILGACEPFWLPTYQRDFVPLGTIAAIDTTYNILDRGYTDLEFPDPNRRNLAFIFTNGTILKREITAAISNGDGTETITINEALGVEFIQRRANGICYLLYGRLSDDLVKMDWWTHDIASVDLTMVELRSVPLTGSAL